MIHLICGPAGAGKTTHALKLARTHAGIRFSIDEWMVALFGEDAPATPNLTWIKARVVRCEARIWATACQIARSGTDIILDLGFQRAAHRRQYADLAAGAGLPAKLHILDLDPEERWRRITARNRTRGETYHLDVTRQMFEVTNTWWEAPEAAEIEAFRVAEHAAPPPYSETR